MDDLQSAIEDAQYMMAVHDNTPKPTKRWRYPSAAEVERFLVDQPQHNSIFEVCQTSLGLYLVRLSIVLYCVVTSYM